jgi:hypothetical protein
VSQKHALPYGAIVEKLGASKAVQHAGMEPWAHGGKLCAQKRDFIPRTHIRIARAQAEDRQLTVIMSAWDYGARGTFFHAHMD